MFDENAELILSFYPNGRYSLRIRCVHGDDGASVMNFDSMSPKQFQKLLHLISKEEYMDYDEYLGLSFRYPVIPFVGEDGGIRFELKKESGDTNNEIDHD